MLRYCLWLPLLLTACMVGPDFHAPETVNNKNYLSKEETRPAAVQTAEKIPDQWWQFYQSKALNQLIAQALQASPGLEEAQARLRSTQESLQADIGSVLYPSVTAGLSGQRQKISGASFGNTNFASIFSLHRASVDVSYVIHPFGRGQRYLEAQQSLVDYQAIQWQAARLMLIGNIVTTVISEASLRAQIQAQQEIITIEQQALAISEQRFALGAIAKNALLLQRTATAQAKTALPSMYKQLANLRHQLAVLCGVMPSDAALPKFTLDALHMPESLPLTLPSSLARQRPDIRAAEALLHQSSAMLGVATSALYPQISISASLAGESLRLVDVLKGQPVWNLGANLLQPLYNAGELQARRRAALADFQAARANYRAVLLQSFSQVADALSALQQDRSSLTLQQHANELAGYSHQLIAEQFKQGSSSQLDLLTAQAQLQQTRLALVQAQAGLLSDSAALMQALGGAITQVNGTQQKETEHD